MRIARRVHMDQVGDERDRQPVVGQRGADEPRAAVVQGRHAVEAVGDEARARVDGGRRPRRTWPRSGRGPRARRARAAARMASTARSCSGPRVTIATVVGERRQPVEVERAHQRRTGGRRASRRGTAPRGGRRRSTGEGPAGRRRSAMRASGAAKASSGAVTSVGTHVVTPCASSSSSRRDQSAPLRVGHVDIVDAVDLQVDEAGDERPRRDGTGGGRDGDDAAAVDLDDTRLEHTVGCDHPRGRGQRASSRSGGQPACFSFGSAWRTRAQPCRSRKRITGQAGSISPGPIDRRAEVGRGVVVVVQPLARGEPGEPLRVGGQVGMGPLAERVTDRVDRRVQRQVEHHVDERGEQPEPRARTAGSRMRDADRQAERARGRTAPGPSGRRAGPRRSGRPRRGSRATRR